MRNIAIVVSALTASAAMAQPAKAPDAATTAAATALVQQIDVRGQVLRSMAQTVAVMKTGAALRSMLAQQPGFAQAYNANKPKFDAALAKGGAIQAEIADKVVRENASAVAAEAVRAYARNYSAAELRALSAFYKTPLGTALAQRQPRVSAEISQATGKLIGAKIDAGMQAAAPRLNAALAPLNSAAPPKK